MDPPETAEIGTKGVRVTRMGLGGFGLGGASPDEPWQDVSDHEAESILERAWELGIRYYDTAANYGRGVSERRVGSALSKLPRDEFVISTKVGKLLNPAPPDKVGTIPGAGPTGPAGRLRLQPRRRPALCGGKSASTRARQR